MKKKWWFLLILLVLILSIRSCLQAKPPLKMEVINNKDIKLTFSPKNDYTGQLYISLSSGEEWGYQSTNTVPNKLIQVYLFLDKDGKAISEKNVSMAVFNEHLSHIKGGKLINNQTEFLLSDYNFEENRTYYFYIDGNNYREDYETVFFCLKNKQFLILDDNSDTNKEEFKQKCSRK